MLSFKLLHILLMDTEHRLRRFSHKSNKSLGMKELLEGSPDNLGGKHHYADGYFNN